MKHLDGLLKLVDNEIGSIVSVGKFRGREDLENAYKLIDIAKDIFCIWCYEDEMGDEYSEAYSREGVAYRGRSYTGNSYGIEPGRDMRSYRGGSSRRSMAYSRDDAKDELIEKIHEMMEKAPDEGKRQTLQRMIQQIENI